MATSGRGAEGSTPGGGEPAPEGQGSGEVRRGLDPQVFQSLIEAAHEAILALTPEGRVVLFNQGAERMFGWSAAEMDGHSIDRLLPPDEVDPHGEHLRRFAKGPPLSRSMSERAPIRGMRRNGQVFPAAASISKLDTPRGPLLTAIISDLTDREAAASADRDREQAVQRADFVDRALSSSLSGMVMTDLQGAVTYVNHAFLDLLGLDSVTTVLGRPVWSFGQDEDGVREILRRVAEEGRWTGDVDARRTDGSVLTVHVIASVVRNGSGDATAIMASFIDVTYRKRAEDLLAHQATHDPLTGLPNRVLLTDRIERALARRARSGTTLAVLFLDLDRFKVVNDSLGHGTGDRVLRGAAERLQGAVREVDTVARFGGDEFVVLCEDLEGAAEARTVANRIMQAFADPFVVEGRALYVQGSVGVALASPGMDDGSEPPTPDALLRNADTAMYRAKELGRGRVTFFDAALRTRAVERLELEQDLREALRSDELWLAFQPQVKLADGRVVGTEALLRWKHVRRGSIPPAVFVPVAEEADLMGRVGKWELDRACEQLAEWHARGYPHLSMFVRFSGRQLAEADAVEAVRSALDRHGVSPSHLTLEIAESVLTGGKQAARGVRALRSLGVRIAIDDFGVGPASLAYLRSFPVDAVKIDRTFVAGLEGGHRGDLAIVRGILAIADELGLQAIADGVETDGQIEALLALGCEYGQGPRFGVPARSPSLGPPGRAPS